jgi:ABC-type nickel/cobalt efflux system permease component RcnA
VTRCTQQYVDIQALLISYKYVRRKSNHLNVSIYSYLFSHAGNQDACPEALGIMVIAIGLNRILLGMGLIVSFSFGLAAVLIIIGVLLVRSRALVERLGGIGTRWSSALPIISAMIVTALGIGITLSGLAKYLG